MADMNVDIEKSLSELSEKLSADEAAIRGETTEFDAGSYVRISPDEMKAYLYLTSVGAPYEREAVVEYLETVGVFDGYIGSNISAMVKKGVYNREIVVAEGKPEKPGKDGYFEYFFDTNPHAGPVIREDGSVDYSGVNAMTNVKAGDLLAKYHHAVTGEDGYSVRGDVIKSKPAKELPALKGKGISNADDPDTYVCTMDGKAEVKPGRIDIQNVYTVGDVDNTAGKIEFYGDIYVSGNVGTGVLIRAGRNVTVQGTVEAATIYAGGDILLAHGIQGNKKALIVADGAVLADFIENSEVEARGDIQANSILNSFVRADGKVKIQGKKGVVLGGEVCGLSGVIASNIGNDAEIRTVVHAGFDAELADELDDKKNEENEIRTELVKTVDDMKEVLRLRRIRGERGAAETNEQLAVLNVKKDELIRKLDENKAEQERLQASLKKGRDGDITVNGNVYRGAVLEICSTRTTIQKKDSFKRYYLEGGAMMNELITYK